MKNIWFLFFVGFLGSLNAQLQHAEPKQRSIPQYLNTDELGKATLFKNAVESVVTIYTSAKTFTDQGPQQNSGLGSGVLISSDCHILTAAHVVDGTNKIKVKTQDGKLRDATVLFSEKSADIALLKLDVPDSSLKHAALGDSDNAVVGQNIYAIGSPYGLENSFSAGIISAFRSFNSVYDGTVQIEFIQTDAAINSGNSGGPLFNSNGEVIGIASSILTVSGGFQGIGMAVTSNTIKGLLAFEDRPWIGIESVFLQSEDLSRLFNLNLSGGLLVQKVAKSSPAHKAGLRGGSVPATIGGRSVLLGGDIILKMDKQSTCHIGCLEGVRNVLASKDKIDITFLRGGKQQMVTVDVSEVRKNFLRE